MKNVDVKTKLVISELILDLSAGRNEPYKLTNKAIVERFKHDLKDYDLTNKEVAKVYRALKCLSPDELIKCSFDVRKIRKKGRMDEVSIVDGTLDNSDQLDRLKEAILDMKDKGTNRLPNELFAFLCGLENDQICKLEEPSRISERTINLEDRYSGIETNTTIIGYNDMLSINQFLERTKFMVLSRFVLNDMLNQIIDFKVFKKFLLWIVDEGDLFSEPLDNVREWIETLEDPFQLVSVYPHVTKQTYENNDTLYIRLL